MSDPCLTRVCLASDLCLTVCLTRVSDRVCPPSGTNRYAAVVWWSARPGRSRSRSAETRPSESGDVHTAPFDGGPAMSVGIVSSDRRVLAGPTVIWLIGKLHECLV